MSLFFITQTKYCFKCNKQWCINYSIYKYYWSTGQKSKFKFYFNCFYTTGIIKKLLSTTIKKKEKHDQILMLAKSKYNSIEALISQALNDLNVSHEKFITILNEKERYERMKENIRDKNECKKQKTIKFSSIK